MNVDLRHATPQSHRYHEFLLRNPKEKLLGNN